MKPKMVTVNAPKRKHLENGTKMHFTWTSAVLASAWHFQTPPQRTCMKLKILPKSTETDILQLIELSIWDHYIFFHKFILLKTTTK